MLMKSKKWFSIMLTALFVLLLAACGGDKESQVVIQSNGDEEAIAALKTALNAKGYEGQYVIQSLGTSELGGKMIAEGNQIDADIVTMSSYFIESAQEQHNMFAELAFETNALAQYPSTVTPCCKRCNATLSL